MGICMHPVSINEKAGITVMLDDSRPKPVYIVQGNFVEDIGGLAIPSSRMWGGFLCNHLEKEHGTWFMYRGVRGDQLDDVLRTGSDISGMAKGGHIFAAYSIKKASQYGRVIRILDQPLQNEVCVILYRSDGLEMADVPGTIEGKDYEHVFVKEPLEALVGCVMLKPTE